MPYIISPVLAALRRLGSVAASLAVFVLSAAIIILESASLGEHTVAARDQQWIEAAFDLRPRRPFADETVRDMRWPPTSGGGYQISYLFTEEDVPAGPAAILVGAASGAVHVHVNGVRLTQGGVDGAPHAALAGMRPVYLPVDPNYFHPARNRIDVTVSGDRLRPVMAVLAFGDAQSLRRVFERHEAWRRVLSPLTRWLAAAAAGLCLLASFAAPRQRWRLLAGAAAMAFGLSLWTATGDAQVRLGPYWPPVSMAFTAAAVFLTGLLLDGLAPAWGGRRVAMASGLLALVFGLAALAALRLHPPAAWGLGMLGVAGAAIPLVRSAIMLLRGAVTGATPPLAAIAATLAAGGVLAWFLAQSGLLTGAGVLDAERVFQTAALALLALAAGSGGGRLGVDIWTRVRDQLDTARVIERQRKQIDTVSGALRQAIEERAVLEERQRLVRDMHDGIGGQLMSMYTRVKARKVSLGQLETDLGAGLQDLRLIVDSLDSVGDSLDAALRAFQDRARRQTDAAGIALHWSQPEEDGVPVRDPGAVLNIYRWMQEALTNAIRHAGATRIDITIETAARDSDLIVAVADNGVGLDAFPEDGVAGRGLKNMMRRASELSGRFDIHPGAEGAGARMVLTAPLGVIARGGASGASTSHKADP